MTTATRARKPRTTAATLIAAEYSQRTTAKVQSLFTVDEWAAPAAEPIALGASEAIAPNASSAAILVFMVAVVAILIFRAALAAVPVIGYGIKKLLQFVSEQRGGKVVDFRVYAPIFED
jgi:hypothetical protein